MYISRRRRSSASAASLRLAKVSRTSRRYLFASSTKKRPSICLSAISAVAPYIDRRPNRPTVPTIAPHGITASKAISNRPDKVIEVEAIKRVSLDSAACFLVSTWDGARQMSPRTSAGFHHGSAEPARGCRSCDQPEQIQERVREMRDTSTGI
jgi:hypothetical protein